MKFAGILNETGPTLNENAFHSFVVAKQIFLWQLPQLHHVIGSYQSQGACKKTHQSKVRV